MLTKNLKYKEGVCLKFRSNSMLCAYSGCIFGYSRLERYSVRWNKGVENRKADDRRNEERAEAKRISCRLYVNSISNEICRRSVPLRLNLSRPTSELLFWPLCIWFFHYVTHNHFWLFKDLMLSITNAHLKRILRVVIDFRAKKKRVLCDLSNWDYKCSCVIGWDFMKYRSDCFVMLVGKLFSPVVRS